MALRVYTASLNQKTDRPKLDTTVKSGAKIFAPTWEMVMGHKRSEIGNNTYTRQYVQMMRDSYKKHKPFWLKALEMDELVLACYCSPGADFCHRYLLAEILERLGAEVVGEITDRGVVPIKRYARPFLQTADTSNTSEKPKQEVKGRFLVRGVRYENRRAILKMMSENPEFFTKLTLQAEPDNPHDRNAVQVMVHYDNGRVVTSWAIGYVPKELAHNLRPNNTKIFSWKIASDRDGGLGLEVTYSKEAS